MTADELLACLADRPCGACKFHTDLGCSSWNCVFEEKIEETEPKGELISREQAIKAVYWDAEAMEAIEQLPSVERKGKPTQAELEDIFREE